MCTIFAQYLYNICILFAHYKTIFIQWPKQNLHNICSILSKNLHNAEGIIFDQYLHNIPTIFVQYLYNIRTIFDPIGISQFMKFVGEIIC